MAKNNWNTAYDQSGKQMIHFFENHKFMVSTNLKTGFATVTNLVTDKIETINVSHYTLDQYADMLSDISEKDETSKWE